MVLLLLLCLGSDKENMSCFPFIDFVELFSGGCFNAFFLSVSNERVVEISHHVKYLLFPPPDDVLGLFFRSKKSE